MPSSSLLTGRSHPQVALQMADGVRRVVNVDGVPADVGVSTTGIAGPDSPDGQPVGTVHVGDRDARRLVDEGAALQGDRDSIRALTVVAALQTLLEFVQE